MKKRVFALFLTLFLSISLVSAVSLEISKQPVSDVVISEINEPAIFNFSIKNTGDSDYFEIYSLSGLDFSPKGTFPIAAGETKNFEVKVYPEAGARANTGITSFAYKIRGQNSGIQDDLIQLTIVKFKDALEIGAAPFSPDSQSVEVYVRNKFKSSFSSIKADFKSVFFEYSDIFSLAPLETAKLIIPLDKDKIRGISAGQYILTSEMSLLNFNGQIEGKMKYLEKSGLSVSDSSSGIIFRKRIVEKSNEGNIPSLAEITVTKDVFSRLFTHFSPEPSKVQRGFFTAKYYWAREIGPAESLEVNVSTNYLYPLLIILGIVLIAYLAYLYNSSVLVVKKRVNFVRTKGGEFALKVTLNVSTRKSVEKVTIIDRLPGIVKIHERFGIYPPDRIDSSKRRLEWDIPYLHPGEERVFSYIIYSKVAVIGRFELPATLAKYEFSGKSQESLSNRAFFMNEPREKESL